MIQRMPIGVALAVFLAWIWPAPSMAEDARVVAHKYLADSDYQRELQLEVGSATLRFMLNPSSVTAGLAVVDEHGNPLSITDNAFSGVLKGDKRSWARLSITRSGLSGVYSQNGRQHEIKTSDSGQITITPLADKHSSLTSKNRSALAATQTPVTRIADIAIVVDSQFNSLHNGNGVEKALSIINSVDGIYREEFGLALRVRNVVAAIDPDNDPFNYGAIPIERMLRNFRAYRMNAQHLRDVSLVHLFTGNRNSDEPVGLAWIDTACRNDGYDVGISTPYRYDILLAAHEIAHNLGAQHDTETACASQLDKVMWPYISPNTSQHFSSCTLESVKQALENSCHAETIDLQVSLNQLSASTLEVTVRNNDLTRANPAATLTVELPDSSIAEAEDTRCQSPGSNIECTFGTLLAGQEDKVAFTLLSTPADDRHADIMVDNPDFADPQPLNNSATLMLNSGVIIGLTTPNAISANDDGDIQLSAALGGFGAIDVIAGMSVLLLFRRRR